MPRQERLDLINAIQAKRNSKVICYLTTDRQGIENQINEDVLPVLYRHLASSDIKPTDNIDLLLYSRGGDSDVPWMVVSLLREYCAEGTFSVLIPHRAHSAASMIALGADSIVMTKRGELGPIDVTLTTPFNPTLKDSSQPLPISVENVIGYTTLLDRLGNTTQQEKALALQLLSQNVHPIALGHIHRVLQETELVTKRMLETRRNPLNSDKNAQIAKTLASDIPSHRHTIRRHEAMNQLSIEFVTTAEDVGIATELEQLFSDYTAWLEVDNVLDIQSYMIVNATEDEHKWENLPIACVESAIGLDVQYTDVRAKRLKDVPNQLNLNLSNIAVPPINVGNLPQGITPDQLAAFVQQLINQTLQQVINQAAAAAMDQLIKNLPSGGMEIAVYNRSWHREV